MTTSLEALVAQFDSRGKPPVEKWSPEKTGTIDIRIDRNGEWYYRDSLIQRKRMVSLFSTILWLEDDNYYLKTPHELLKIEVEVAPFSAVLLDVSGQGESQSLCFTDKTGNRFTAGKDNRLWLSQSPDAESLPLVIVRRNLPALLSRPVYYQLAELLVNHNDSAGVWSDGVFFQLA